MTLRRPTMCAALLPALTGMALLASSQAGTARQESPAPAPATRSLPPGYLPRASLPDSLALLPPPPAPGSAAFGHDEEAHARAGASRGSARWILAVADAALTPPQAAGAFSCAAEVEIGGESTPRLNHLLGKMLIDVGLAPYGAKQRYQRTRPFVVHGETTCTPDEEAELRGDGSYPSGHSAIGWGWALVLAELHPAHADALLQRGRDFGQSRLVCNAHWQSDIDAGRTIAAATVARLHADPQFRADLKAARAELAAAHDAGRVPARDCAAEAAALAADRAR